MSKNLDCVDAQPRGDEWALEEQSKYESYGDCNWQYGNKNSTNVLHALCCLMIDEWCNLEVNRARFNMLAIGWCEFASPIFDRELHIIVIADFTKNLDLLADLFSSFDVNLELGNLTIKCLQLPFGRQTGQMRAL